MKKLSILCTAVLLMGGCSKATLIDQTINSFTASASKDKNDRVTVTWVTNGYYKNYQVLRSASSNGTYVPVSENISADSFDDTKTPRGVSFYYKVRGFNNLSMPLFTTADSAEGVAGSSAFTPPTTLTVSQGESGSKIILRWERVNDAVAYQIFRSPDKKGTFLPLTNTVYLEYEDDTGDDGKPMKSGDIYYYKIASINADGDTSADNYPFGDEGLAGSIFGGTASLSTEAGKYEDKVELNWQLVPDVKVYDIYRSDLRSSVGSSIGEVPGHIQTFTDRSVEKGKVYYYTIFFQGDQSLTLQQGETVKGYLKVATAPSMPENFTVSQGEDPQYVKLSWDPVAGATGYEVSRSAAAEGPWEDITLTVGTDSVTAKKIAKDDPYTGAAVQSFSYYYKVVALNPAPGQYTAPLQGWANKAPANITASKTYGGRVRLNWDAVPGAVKYTVSYSSAKGGPYTEAGALSPKPGASREEYSHVLDISPDTERTLYYKVAVETSSGRTSDPSEPIEGMISKIAAPQNLLVRNNASTDISDKQMLKLAWDRVLNAGGYRVYRATLMHRHAAVSALKPSDYTFIGGAANNSYQDSLTSYPLRRYDYKIVAVDLDGAEGAPVYTKDVVATADKSTYRLPVDTMDFMKDVDKTIVEAQTRINNFGGMGSLGTPKARASGDYDYVAGTSAVNNWRNFTSFEITLNGATSFSVNMGSMTASQSGPVQVTGLYNGTVTYNGLVGALGGYTTGGTITVSYGGVNKTYPFGELSALDNIVLTSESKPSYPSYVPGGGGTLQPGWSR